ncbi:DUF262 domain-containing protein [Acinetobacter pseudolwoffii]|uniref:DUF262 domain-containing protein n=1 Tax=Acinetobacter pseudolwoffii TaxID=2053287 RepID=UPI000C23C410|nr:DUF262 domain-containing protein [Acinetobacter pseudolwoffii]PJI30912.1 hypothetical protein CU478_01145 [Acinetobacter pseudolwoffii]
MLSANKEQISSFLEGSLQFHIPFFQRPYVWKIENWQEFFDSVLEQFDKDNLETSEHFIGTIIVQQKEAKKMGANEYDLVDGQQRLTTICLLIRAIHDEIEDKDLKDWVKKLIIFTDKRGKANPRIVHSQNDRNKFEKLLIDEKENFEIWNEVEDFDLTLLEKYIELSLSNNAIDGCYLYFRKRLVDMLNEKSTDNEERDEYLNAFLDVILNNLPIIHMALSKGDDVQEIFDTINSQGVKLTTSELLKNYLFRNEQESIDLYKENWYSVFEQNEDDIEFWSSERTSGRIRRSTIELFLYSYLVITKEAPVKLEKLFKEYKNLIKGKSKDELAVLIKDLKEHAVVYRAIPDGIDLKSLAYKEYKKRFFQIVSEFEITTIMPLMLYIMKQVQDESELEKILAVLESYIARRTICKLTTKNYNNLFLGLLIEVKKWNEITSKKLLEKLLTYTEDTNIFPSDDQVQAAVFEKALINKYTREILYIISLYDLNDPKTDNHSLSLEGFSLEHLMPKKWENNWEIPDSKEKIELNNFKLLTLGNLALIKGSLNSKLRDSAWPIKRKELNTYSTLNRTRECLGNEVWDVKAINERSEKLYETIVEIWKK